MWNGGFSTFLAIVLLAFSSSYVFKTFFKVIGKELLVNVAQLYSTTVASLGFSFLKNEERRFEKLPDNYITRVIKSKIVETTCRWTKIAMY